MEFDFFENFYTQEPFRWKVREKNTITPTGAGCAHPYQKIGTSLKIAKLTPTPPENCS